jgi:hypothetical protein
MRICCQVEKITTRDSREMEEAGSEGGVQVGGREGSVTGIAIAEDFFSLKSSCTSGTLMDCKKVSMIII